MNCAIVGFGHVGQAMVKLFPKAIVYDEQKDMGTRERVNTCEVAFVCVPTPQKITGECDTSIVEEVLGWLNTELIIIRSTVPIGFTKKMASILNKKLVFQPEYYGETVAHPLTNLEDRGWISLGGKQDAIDMAIELYQQVYNSDIHFYMADSDAVEMAKYMSNAFLAAKVTFCNEMCDLAEILGVNYNVVREMWTADPRIGRSHTFVYKQNRGYGGSCFPKDISALISIGEAVHADMSLLKSVSKKNKMIQDKESGQGE